MLTKLRSTMRDAKDRGASAVEYGLMVAAIAAVIVAIVFGLGTLVSGTFRDTCTAIQNGQANNLPAGGVAPELPDGCAAND